MSEREMLITNCGAFRHSQREEPQSAVSGGSCNQRENETDTAVRSVRRFVLFWIKSSFINSSDNCLHRKSAKECKCSDS